MPQPLSTIITEVVSGLKESIKRIKSSGFEIERFDVQTNQVEDSQGTRCTIDLKIILLRSK